MAAMPDSHSGTTVEDAIKDLARVVKEGFQNIENQLNEIKKSVSLKADGPSNGRQVSTPFARSTPYVAALKSMQPLFCFDNISSPDVNFHRFSYLPPELRMKIWKMAALERRIFEPCIEPYRRDIIHNRRPQRGQHADPPIVELRRKYKPPAFLATCRESRQASAMVGGLEFGLYGTARAGCWLNYESDIVFIHTDMIDKLHYMNLSRVKLLAFSNRQFMTEETCMEILGRVLECSPLCQTIHFCFCSQTVQCSNTLRMSRATARQLEDEDLVGHYQALGNRGIPNGPVKWGDLRRAVVKIWEEQLLRLGLDTVTRPSLVGLDIIRFD